MKKCTLGPRHNWQFVKNVVTKSQTLYTAIIKQRGVYKCACGEKKYGQMQS